MLISFTAGICLFTSSARAATVEMTTLPNQIYIERSDNGQFINFDFAVKNLNDNTIWVKSIEISVYDEKGKLSFRRAIDSGGFSPAIETVSNREIAARQTVIIFNPLYSFEPFLKLKRLRYVFSFAVGDKTEEREITVTPVEYQTKTNLILPIRRRLQITSGHDFYAHHRRFDYLHPVARQIGFKSNFMRYGYDFFVVDENGDKSKGDDKILENYFGFGEPVLAPGAGKAVALRNDFPEDLFGQMLSVENIVKEPFLFYGNFVVIDHGNGEFSMLAHLKQNSLRVKVGDTIKQGQQIARIGASGSAETPHLHYELRNGQGFDVEGLPSYFSNFRRVLGWQTNHVKRGRIDSGEIVETNAKTDKR